MGERGSIGGGGGPQGAMWGWATGVGAQGGGGGEKSTTKRKGGGEMPTQVVGGGGRDGAEAGTMWQRSKNPIGEGPWTPEKRNKKETP